MSITITKLHMNTVRNTITSCLVAMAFLFNSICLLVGILFPAISGFGDVFVIIILFIGFLLCLTSPMRLIRNVIFMNLLLLLAIILSYIYYRFSPMIYTLMLNFFAWGIGIAVIMMQDYDLRKTINISYVFSTITCIFELIFNAHNLYEPMTWTYAIFPCLATIIVHFIYCRYSGILLKLFYIPGLLMLFKFFLYANRGGVVSLLLLIYLVSIKGKNSNSNKLRNKKILNILLLILLVCSVFFYEQIIAILYNLLSQRDIEVSALSKMYRMIGLGNVTNNRNELYIYAWNGFLESPLWGNGIGGFSVNHGGWTHNFVLQILYEGGIALFIIIIVPLVKIVVFFINGKQVTNEEYSLFALFFCTSVPRLLFSTELWNTQGFWMLLAFGMITIKKHKNIRKEN
ncbi:O-antigen ligase family protein [Lactonifactor longoviformis]|uniref:O-antigen ligase-related domain-containing protein n=2 Tax=Lactonifactor TaxID=420345 RepID=A0A1M4YMX4_9CLOT|nr:O-antigen ligase family protein [Lactonifactor longoviformis]SHF07159.1 hypothetical protein SAMN02745158_02423 [Lactonifactor longoviformis DSM 17459]